MNLGLLHFQTPAFLWLFPLIFLLLFFYAAFLFRKKNFKNYSNLSFFKLKGKSKYNNIAHFSFFINVLLLSLIVIALARPQTKIGESIDRKNAIDIIFALDISSSMDYEDFTPNRLEVAKKKIIDFIDLRKNDRMGLVVFGKEAFLQSPLTFDKDFLKTFVEQVTFLDGVKSQTAIGSALATSIIALKDSEAKSKIIILLTDGNNNAGEIDPITASNLAQNYGIKIYTIGIGKPGRTIVKKTIDDPVFNKRIIPIEIFMDEKILINLAQTTGADYFNVKNEAGFSRAYKEIDNLEKTKITDINYVIYKDYFPELLFLIFLLLLVYVLFMALFETENN